MQLKLVRHGILQQIPAITDKTTVQGGDTVDLINGDNILITKMVQIKRKLL